MNQIREFYLFFFLCPSQTRSNARTIIFRRFFFTKKEKKKKGKTVTQIDGGELVGRATAILSGWAMQAHLT